MKYEKLLVLLLTACLLFSLSGCKKGEEEEVPEEPIDPNFPITLELENDTVTIHEAPDSVVSLSPAITSLFYDLGEDSLLNGVSSYAPKEASAKTDCGTAQHIDLKAVENISPDLLFTDTPLLNEQLIELQQMDVEVILIQRPESEQELMERAERILLALYGKEDGAAKAEKYSKSWEELWESLNMIEVEEPTSVLLLADLDLAATGDVWEGQILEKLGMDNLCADGENWQLPGAQTLEDGTVQYVYGEDVTVDWNPAVIFYNSELDVEMIKASELYMSSEAVANDALYPVDWTVLQLQNGELPKLFGSMVEQVYPELWEEIRIDITERKAQEAAAQAAAEAEAEEENTEGETEEK